VPPARTSRAGAARTAARPQRPRPGDRPVPPAARRSRGRHRRGGPPLRRRPRGLTRPAKLRAGVSGSRGRSSRPARQGGRREGRSPRGAPRHPRPRRPAVASGRRR
jgi:hypothetical protein